MSFESYSESRIQLINAYISNSLDKFRTTTSQRFSPLIDAMEYSLEGGGKRLRPLLVLASAESLGLSAESVLPAAVAIEYIHTYSLIHDDLPALDDDDSRRGKPSSHKKFGEAVAILTGDALLTEAFSEILQLSKSFQPVQVLSAIELLSQSSGVKGMVGGQYFDVTCETESVCLPEIEFIHIHKTGAMILASVLMPTRLTHLEASTIQHFRRYGEALGLAFQISDDILDSETSIRYSRGPRKKPKPTYSNMIGPSELKLKLKGLVETAKESIQSIGNKAKPLIEIAEFVQNRKK